MGSEAKTRIGLWFVLGTTLFTFGQLFATGDYPGPALLGMLMATGLAIAVRRTGFGAIISFIVSAVALLWYLGLVFAADKTLLSLPTPASLAALGRALSRAVEHSRVDYAPIPLRNGYAIAVVAAMWLATTAGEIATFRWRRPLAASIGPIVIFSFALTVGTGNAAGLHVAVFLTALLTYWGLESAHRLRSWGNWVSAWSHQRSTEPETLTGDLARRIGAAAVACALISPVFLPALQDGLLSWRSGVGGGPGEGGGGGRLNPWVSIVPDIPNQTDTQLFTVEASESDYWRIASLEYFNGEEWEEADRNRVPTEGGFLPASADGPTEELTQVVTVRALEGEFLPAAVKPVAVERLDVPEPEAFAGIDVDPDSGSVLLDDSLQAGDRFRIISGTPALSYRDLLRASPPRPDNFDLAYFQMSQRLTPEVDDLIDRWTEDAKTPFAKLIEVQRQLRAFDYTLEPENPQGNDLVGDFLLRTKEGFCQQFATAFAVIARHLGYPSRVSVGFLPGERNDVANRFTVRGTDAHAWPEVYFENHGWVAFEPTPRDDSFAPRYTLPPVDGPDGSGQGGSGIPEFNNPFSDTGEGTQRGEQTEIGGANVDPNLNPREQQAAEQRRRRAGEAAWQKTFARLLTFTILAVLLFLLFVPGLKELRIRRRYARAEGPDALAAAAFAHLVDEATELASGKRPSESALAFARRLAASQRVNDRTALRLAEIFEAAAYSPNGIDGARAEEAKRLAKALRLQLWSKASWWERALRLFSPRRLAL